MTDHELITELLGTELSDSQREAFTDMAEWLDGGEGRKLTVKQHSWVHAASVAANIVADDSQNLYSAGLVPDGLKTPKTRGEQFAAKVLSHRPAKPPGRSA